MNFITHQLRALLYAVSEYRLGYATDAPGLELLLSAHSCQIIFVKCELGLERIKSAGEGVGTADHHNSSTSRAVYAVGEYRLGHAPDALGLKVLPSAYSCRLTFAKCELGWNGSSPRASLYAGEGVGTADHHYSSTSRTVYAVSEYRLSHATDALGLKLLLSAYSY